MFHVEPSQKLVDSDAEQVFTWVLRGVYLAVVGAYFVVVYDLYKDRPGIVNLRAKAAARWHQMQNCEGCAKRKAAIRRATNKMMFEATEVVETAAADTESES